MSQLAEKTFFDADAYLAWEAEQSARHEYVHGEVFAMTGALEAHVTIAGNVFMALRNHLRGGPCSVFISDMKLRVAADNAFYYPDVFVTCADSDRAENRYKSAPSLIVEVLSASTGAYDRGDKFASYRKLPSLREYALVNPERISVDLFRRDDQGRWVLHPFEPGQTVELASVELSLPIEALYEDVRFDPEASAHP
ncbi:MAG: Uma2 family endonuclease [Lysobacteraceae bacterium]